MSDEQITVRCADCEREYTVYESEVRAWLNGKVGNVE